MNGSREVNIIVATGPGGECSYYGPFYCEAESDLFAERFYEQWGSRYTLRPAPLIDDAELAPQVPLPRDEPDIVPLRGVYRDAL